MLSVFDIFKIGVGPSSSHTVGPMRIARRFLKEATKRNFQRATRIRIDLHGSLALTGIGHGTDRAVILGLLGFEPETASPPDMDAAIEKVQRDNKLRLFTGAVLPFDKSTDLCFRGDIVSGVHPNEMRLSLIDKAGDAVFSQVYYSVGGGFIASAKQLSSNAKDDLIDRPAVGPHQFASAAQLLEICRAEDKPIDAIMLDNEDARRPRPETSAKLDLIWTAMNECIDHGLRGDGKLPGSLEVRRRAAELYRKLRDTPLGNEPERIFDWLNVYAMAVNEENAAGGRVVTAPTNGAAGIIPAVIRHYCCENGDANASQIHTFLLTAAAIGILYKQRASISGAEMGCQGEVGVACSMAAAGLAAVWGGAPAQVEHAAEIGMEHNLGLTCDPVGGLVQIPCIERNAIGAVKAVNAARLALRAAEEP
ncbi:MAG: L-serine ammonia-lyase, partial [Pseudomonadota bacterium]